MENDGQLKTEKWSWMNHKPDNMFTIEGTPTKNFFKWWCIIMNPFIALTPRETDLMASFLKQRHELSKKILDPTLIDSQLMNNETRKKIIDECGILRNKGILTDAGINPRIIPRISKDNNGYCQLLLLFKDETIK